MTQEIEAVVTPAAEPVVVETKVDRGDDYTPPVEVEVKAPAPAPVIEPEVPANPLAEGEVKPAEVKDDAKVKEGEEERPRDADGKFLPKPPVMIPKARFDEVNTKARAKVAELTGRIKDLESRLSPAGQAPDVAALNVTIEAKTAEYGKLIADGELDQANAVMRDILAANRQISAAESAVLTSAHGVETQNVQTITELVDLYKGNYPVFDDKAADYNQDMVNFVADLQDRFERTGSSSAEALREAVELAVAKFSLDVAPEPAVDPAVAAKDKVVQDRKSAATKASAAAAALQSPDMKTGLDSDKAGMQNVTPSTLTFQEFSALPESTLKRLRGDLL